MVSQVAEQLQRAVETAADGPAITTALKVCVYICIFTGLNELERTVAFV